MVVGAAGFAKISAVEGIRLSPAMKKRAAEAGSKGLTAEDPAARLFVTIARAKLPSHV
jgi:hypothetical protein